ncbi:CoA ester lyase [Siculibacillus lacustris]|uniref:CoA ester lyase n=1 Tax=Siculibacillus lacustris TaxID=1549641 RepID=A0A4Q9VW83_9HYPH|nr:CoA ester lyase [Siculibacillus lacustris]TBW40093.1 CoA ester lyase [Siculibacillus lacustris]
MTIRPRRSVLYMPGSNARALDKAKTLATDAVILDLEDSVAPDAKEVARAQVVAAVTAGGFGSREVVIRINGLAGPWGRADLAAAGAAAPDAILIPKVSTAADVFEAGAILDALGVPERVAIWAMFETPLAVLNAGAIAAARHETAGRRLTVMVLGTNDLAKETRARFVPGRAPMLPWLAIALAAARAHGLEVIDGVYNNLSDAEGYRLECEQGRDLGMDGKTLIHPNQLAVANEVFSPTAEEVAQGEKIIAAFALPENALKAVISLDGRMVERLHAEMAERTVAIARAIAAIGA